MNIFRLDEMKIENRKTIEKINKSKSWIFEKINKIDNTLARVPKIKERRFKLLKSGMKKERDSSTNLTEINRIT